MFKKLFLYFSCLDSANWDNIFYINLFTTLKILAFRNSSVTYKILLVLREFCLLLLNFIFFIFKLNNVIIYHFLKCIKKTNFELCFLIVKYFSSPQFFSVYYFCCVLDLVCLIRVLDLVCLITALKLITSIHGYFDFKFLNIKN